MYLGVAIAVHALLAQALYGGYLIDVHAPVDQVRQGAQIMYYGGDIAELLLAGVLVATWRPERRTRSAARGRPARVAAGGTVGVGVGRVVRLFHRFERFDDEAVGLAVSVSSNFQMTWRQYLPDGLGAARWR
ncbi:cytochrome c oxidase assembly protein [Streptomyces misionensis]|uniref:hypothetical protein n=1 Tax=Streptomyces misionensis TaxID=67331 RepID=UPI0036AA0847